MRRYHLGSSSPPDDDQDLLRLRIRRPQRFDHLGSMPCPKSHPAESAQEPHGNRFDDILEGTPKGTVHTVHLREAALYGFDHILPRPATVRHDYP